MSDQPINDENKLDEQAELAKLRDKIDAIDNQIGELISDRARCAMDVAKVKSARDR